MESNMHNRGCIIITVKKYLTSGVSGNSHSLKEILQENLPRLAW